MRAIIVILLVSLCAIVGSTTINYPTRFYTDKTTTTTTTSTTTLLEKQKIIYDAFQHVHQYNLNYEWYKFAETFNFEDYYSCFKNVDAIMEFVHMYRFGNFLPFNEVFSIMNDFHRKQAIALFHVFYYANDWDTFYKVLMWSKFHVNEGIFVYALTVAILHRPDMKDIELPAIYEIYPQYFFNTDVIQRAQSFKMTGNFKDFKLIDGVYTIMIPTYNYTKTNYYYNYGTNDDYFENKLTYFTEDIGLNAYYYYFHADYPFWMSGREFGLFNDRRGELYLFQHQQFLARYYMERLSNGLGRIPEFSFYKPLKTSYYSGLRYYNGQYFTNRNDNYDIYDETSYYDVDTFYGMEIRIRDAIDMGYFVLHDGTHIDLTKWESINYLGNFIQANPDTDFTRFYGYLELFARLLLGGGSGGGTTDSYGYGFTGKYPSVLEHFETSMRDPVFYQLYKRIIKFYWRFKNHLPSYRFDELTFKGVNIESVTMDPLITYFDYFDADITNAVDVEDTTNFDWSTTMMGNDFSTTKTFNKMYNTGTKRFNKYFDFKKTYDFDDTTTNYYRDTKDTKYYDKYDKFDKYDKKYTNGKFDKFYHDKVVDTTDDFDGKYYDMKTNTKTYHDTMFNKVPTTTTTGYWYSKYNKNDFVIKARQYRLTHKPFNFYLNVVSDKVQKSLIKLFIGPKYDEFGHIFDINENRENFFELDYFVYDLKVGMNKITRNCMDFAFFTSDRTTYYDLYKTLMNYKTTTTYTKDYMHCKFPWRLMLPRGTTSGMPFQFFFYVMPFVDYTTNYDTTTTGFDNTYSYNSYDYTKSTFGHNKQYYPTGTKTTTTTNWYSCGVGTGVNRYLTKYPFGFPLDRKIDETYWFTPNMYYFDTKITYMTNDYMY